MTEQYNCEKCENPDSIEDMVECEDCLKWFHYSCVGVTANISKQNWKCNKCLSLKKTSKAGSAILSGAGSRVSQKTYLSKQSEIELELEKLEAERILEEKHRKQKLELEQQNLKLQQQQKQQQIQLQNQKDIEEKEKEYLKKRFELKKKLQSSSCGGSIKNDIFEKDVIESVSNWLTSKPQKVDNIKQKSSDFTNIWNLSKQVDDITVSKSTGAIKKLNFKENIYGDKNETWSYKAPQSTYVRQGEKVLTDFNDNTTNFYNNDAINKFSSILSSQQLASRKAFSKDLPYFNGLPEGWPLFISSFNATTQMCGYTNEENLIRLQKALKGRALETVRSKLMLPINVPSIIKTLGNIFGRPELILQNLIAKIKSEPLPKFEKFETIRDYALSVENLCATMEASNMIYHINNPILLQELIDRLPTQMKYDWASHVRAVPGYNISTLSIWLNHVSENLSMVSLRNPSTTMMENKQTNRRINNYKDTNFIYTHREEVKNKNDFKIKYNNQTNEKKCCICGKTCTTIKNCQTFQNLNLEEKWNAVHKNKLCRTCLVSHNGSECFSKNKCLKNGCTYRHNPLLHNDKKDQRQQNETSKPVKTIEQNEVSGGYSCTTHQQNNQSILFRIVPVVLYGENSKVETFAFLDEGSSLTLMEQQLAEELNLNGIVEPLCLRWTSNNSRVEEKSERVNLKISSTNKNAEKYSIINARTVSSLNLPKQTLSSEEFGKYKYMKGLSIKTYMQAEPRILIGLDNSKLGASLKLREGGQYEPIAVKTRLGWIVYGALQQNIVAKDDVKFNGFHICECEKSKDDMVQQIVKDYILLDNLGVTNTNKSLLSKDDERSMQILESSTNKIGNRFETGLIWKYDQFILPNSLPMAKRRLECLEKKMQREPELAANIKKKISEYIEKNYIHKITKKELLLNHPRVWYLPIFTVTNPNKPGKIRMVWDAAAKVNGVSLNEMLLKGPDQLASLPAILQRFRERKIGICGDIKEMFHQIRIKEDDRQSQRFLYRDDPNKEPDIYVMDVMTFGATCSPSCAQFIKNKNALSYIDEYPNAVNTIIENHYVDDLLESVDTEEDAIKLANDVKFVHQQGGFEICNWISNSEKVINALGEKVKIANKDLNIDPELEIEKILGMWWCTSTDTFTYSLKYNQLNNDILNGKRCPTKREVLRTLMKIYDPLGLIANFLIYLKILLQDIWRSSVDWDDEITKDQYIRWLNWISVLPKVEKIQIQRCYIANTSINREKIQLHIFVDASEKAYAAVAYLRIGEDDQVECSLVGSKTRVAPIKLLSIPRLELQAAILGSRLATSIEANQSIKIAERYFWCDSKTVIGWLNSEQRKFKQFVAFRIGELLEATNVREWFWIPTKQNVADEATKWTKIPDVSNNSRWFTGPEFLYRPKEEWPNHSVEYTTSEEEIMTHLYHDFVALENIIEPERFSKWFVLVRSVAYVYRFINNIKKNKVGKLYGPISQDEYRKAENYLYRHVQKEGFPNEVNILIKNKYFADDKKLVIGKSSPIYKQSPYLDENGIMRVRGRIDAMIDVPIDIKRPIILLKSHYITQLIIKSYHEKYYHLNNEIVVNEIRQKYSISKLRAAVRKVYKNCQWCKNKKVVPKPPEMGELPMARLSTFIRPFSFVGIDYFGPITVSVGRRSEKRWGVLVTCLTIRAIHIEIAHTLTTDSCILSLRNFMARRGTPIEIYSDNGTNFHGANNEIKLAIEKFDKNRLIQEFTTSTSKWIFIPPASPHMGGSWERLIQSVKKILYEIMPMRNPTDELLRSMLIEVENIVNSRPLTYIPVEDDQEEALTPNHFLLGSSSGIKPFGEFNSDREILRSNWKISQRYADMFWKRWIREYLPTITKRTKWFEPVKPIEVGDIVIIVDENFPRNTWKKGKVLRTKTSKDGQVRSADIQTSSGVYERPAVKLAVLDVRAKTDVKPNKECIVITEGSVTTSDCTDIK